jgi:mycofactocin system creatininase family protein
LRLAEVAWPALAGGARQRLLVLPLGSTEQHGPHLPFTTDTDIAVALADRLAEARPDVVVAPPLAYGSSGEHAHFGGTLSMGATALELVLVELVRSADAFGGTVIVSAHGGNAGPAAAASSTLLPEGRPVLVWSPRVPGGDAHAGRTETSLMLALDPARVSVDRAEAGDTRPLREVMAALRTGGVAAVSPNGVLGDPAGASAEEGAALLDTLAADLVTAVARWWGTPR